MRNRKSKTIGGLLYGSQYWLLTSTFRGKTEYVCTQSTRTLLRAKLGVAGTGKDQGERCDACKGESRRCRATIRHLRRRNNSNC
eukprot:6207122-Pleurochrysis_carterae.AAC.2